MEETTNFTKYEKARMIGARALQISMGAPFMVKLSEEDIKKIRYNPIKIAEIEFDKGVIPLIVRRPLPDTSKEAKGEEEEFEEDEAEEEEQSSKEEDDSEE